MITHKPNQFGYCLNKKGEVVEDKTEQDTIKVMLEQRDQYQSATIDMTTGQVTTGNRGFQKADTADLGTSSPVFSRVQSRSGNIEDAGPNTVVSGPSKLMAYAERAGWGPVVGLPTFQGDTMVYHFESGRRGFVRLPIGTEFE